MSRQIVTPVGILSYPSLWEMKPKGPNSDKLAYAASLIFPASADLSELRKLCKEVAVARFGEPLPSLRSPIRRNNEDNYANKAGYKEHPEGFFISCKNDRRKPKVVDQLKQEISPELGNSDKIYAGCKVIAAISAYSYAAPGNKGIAFQLLAIQLVEGGTPLAADDDVDTDEVFSTLEEKADPNLISTPDVATDADDDLF